MARSERTGNTSALHKVRMLMEVRESTDSICGETSEIYSRGQIKPGRWKVNALWFLKRCWERRTHMTRRDWWKDVGRLQNMVTWKCVKAHYFGIWKRNGSGVAVWAHWRIADFEVPKQWTIAGISTQNRWKSLRENFHLKIYFRLSWINFKAA